MIHSFAKLVSKILALRLAPKMHTLISFEQNAFIRGRSIHDNFKYIQRAVLMLRKKRPKILLKLDVAKAFDTVLWPFLLDVRQAMGFGVRWRRWITTLLTTASSNILMNGQQGKRIRHRRGVRQGDSLSPCCSSAPWKYLVACSPRPEKTVYLGALTTMESDSSAACTRTTSSFSRTRTLMKLRPSRACCESSRRSRASKPIWRSVRLRTFTGQKRPSPTCN